MLLLNTHTLKLEEFYGEIPKYAILSHTWEKEEVSLQDLTKPDVERLAGYARITSCCRLAASEGRDYAWIDTCCIDKKSSAELSEAINSMYQWYKDAEICYAYLSDVLIGSPEPQEADDVLRAATNFPNALPKYLEDFMRKARWFTRGWTLQELLAPSEVVFYDRNWLRIRTRHDLRGLISSVTAIGFEHLSNPLSASVAQKMSWASRRKTTRIEDVSYCLLGLFDVNMPLLYGEGRKAFLRLQQEILKNVEDESLFAWDDPSLRYAGMFALSPTAFANCGNIVPVEFSGIRRSPWTFTNRGLAMQSNHKPFNFGSGISAMWGSVSSLRTHSIALYCAPTRHKDALVVIQVYLDSGGNCIRNPSKGLSLSPISQESAIERPADRVIYARPVYLPLTPLLDDHESFTLSIVSKGYEIMLYSAYTINITSTLWDEKTWKITIRQGFAIFQFAISKMSLLHIMVKRYHDKLSFEVDTISETNPTPVLKSLDTAPCFQILDDEREVSVCLSPEFSKNGRTLYIDVRDVGGSRNGHSFFTPEILQSFRDMDSHNS